MHPVVVADLDPVEVPSEGAVVVFDRSAGVDVKRQPLNAVAAVANRATASFLSDDITTSLVF